MYATGVLGLLQSHPELMSGFVAFFPPARDVLVSSTSPRATRDPLGQPPAAVPHDTKQVVEEFLMAVKARFADRPMVYNTFLRVLQKYRFVFSLFLTDGLSNISSLTSFRVSDSKDKQEAINTITTLLGGDPDLMNGLKELDLLYHIHCACLLVAFTPLAHVYSRACPSLPFFDTSSHSSLRAGHVQ